VGGAGERGTPLPVHSIGEGSSLVPASSARGYGDRVTLPYRASDDVKEYCAQVYEAV